ncbi:hypothetical protein [Variovorax ginsengisoli]|uniref:Uncharacterized protein n=1 Tax=Variovorax ginsengisoli TaxID=363844 RepID=A0ABT8SBL8_9BURK|nr:hypothetical protein [Variovorax ginsengisoli]MDN8617141.1 hypothetical protein [Variovorax ginsengisoli]MDO1536311.1 hypothetical protein [Variovorax ginsengisoli]
MQSPIDTQAVADFLRPPVGHYPGLLIGFSSFRTHVEAVGNKNPYFPWKIGALATNGLSFEIEFLTVRLRAILSIRPSVDNRGVMTFYRLDEFDLKAAQAIEELDFEAEDFDTGVKKSSGETLYLSLEPHATILLATVLAKVLGKPLVGQP